MSAYEHWIWSNCSAQILTLKGRLGFDDRLWILGFDLTDNGAFFDPYLDREIFNPKVSIEPTLVPLYYNAIPEMICILFNYSQVTTINYSGEYISPDFELNTQECESLLKYQTISFDLLKEKSRFFGDVMDFGDFSFKVWPLPMIPVVFIIYRGDDEIPHGCSILFDRSLKEHLSGFLNELGALTVWRLQNILDPAINWGYCTARLEKESKEL